MNRKTRENVVFRGMGWMIGSVSILFLMSVGLELFVRQAFRQADFATILLALTLASWSFVLGLVGLIFLTVWWLSSWRSARIKQAVVSQDSPAEPSRQPFDNPGWNGPEGMNSVRKNIRPTGVC